jgi:DNA mismatch repair protein MutS
MTSILDVPEHLLTPGMKQYRDAKREHPDCVIMLRMGDFYEMFYEDAQLAAKELEITLTSRGKGEKTAPLAGVPYHALEPYLGKFIKKGYRVAIVEQLEDPKLAKGLVKRGVVRVVTPGTVIESSLLSEKDNNYVGAIRTNAHQQSFAFCDLSTGEFLCGKTSTLQELLSHITKHNVTECLVPESLLVNHEFISELKKQKVFVTSFDDFHFRYENANMVLLNHFNVADISSFGILDKTIIGVCGALIHYLHETQKTHLAHIKKIQQLHSKEHMHLDKSTVRNLELMHNIIDRSSKGTLISILDHTTTSLGARLLKKVMTLPLLSQEKIEERLRAVDELRNQTIARQEISEILSSVYDIERLIGRVNFGNASPRDLLALQKTLQQLPLLKEKLGMFSSKLLKKIGSFDMLQQTSHLLNTSINEEAPITIREGGIIKQGFNQELDELLDIKQNSKKFLAEIERKEKEKTGITTLRISFNRVFGYFIEITKRFSDKVPEHYIRKQTTANSERYITEELKIEEEKILGAQEKITSLEYNLFIQINNEVKKKTSQIQQIASSIALLDVLCSFSIVSLKNNYCKPKFNSLEKIEIIDGRHPVVEKIEQTFVPNTVILHDKEFMVITGPNTSGKSTVMRQTALICLMAQIGSYVPATHANLTLLDRIFTRVGAHDDLSSGQSTFMVEMLETAHILQTATNKSLLILDEIGRGTSTFDGVAIAWSTAEHIYNTIGAKTMFATHYHVLNKLANKFERIKNYNVAVKEVEGDIIFLRKLVEGGTDQSHGVHVAKLAGMPETVVTRARELQEALEAEDTMIKKIKEKRLQDQKSLGEF